jgi:hypothetical protein
MASASAAPASTRATSRPPWETIVAVAALLAQGLWYLEIHRVFGLPAHPLLIHVPVIFVPLLGLTVLVLAASKKLFDRFLLPVAAFSVVTMAATILAAGAGEAFKEDRENAMPPGMTVDPTLTDHADAGSALRLAMVLLTLTLVVSLFTRPNVARVVLRVLAVLLALTAVFFVIRTGHLGAKLAWGDQRGGPPAGLQDPSNYGGLPEDG